MFHDLNWCAKALRSNAAPKQHSRTILLVAAGYRGRWILLLVVSPPKSFCPSAKGVLIFETATGERLCVCARHSATTQHACSQVGIVPLTLLINVLIVYDHDLHSLFK
jgi:hypothetical protein